MMLTQEHVLDQLMSQLTEIEPNILKISFKGNINGSEMRSIRKASELVLTASNEKRIYFILDLNDFDSIDLEARLCILDKIKLSSKLMSFIIFGLADNKREMHYYLNENAPHISVFITENESEAILKARELNSMSQTKPLTFGPTYFSGISKEEVIISGKTLNQVHDKKWSYTNPDETYYYRIDLIDSDILISKPSGYLNYKKVLVTNVLLDKVVNRVIGQKKHYYQMIDYSDVMSCTMNVKRNIINNIERTDYMVFYGLSLYMKLVVYIRKQLYPNFNRVMIADSYEEALKMILVHKYGSDYFKPKAENN